MWRLTQEEMDVLVAQCAQLKDPTPCIGRADIIRIVADLADARRALEAVEELAAEDHAVQIVRSVSGGWHIVVGPESYVGMTLPEALDAALAVKEGGGE